MAVFFSGALGLHRQAKIALLFFIPHMLIEIVLAPFGWIFHFDADVYGALTSERCYKKAMPPKEAVKTIKEESGTHFDPKLVDIFLKYIDETDKSVPERS